MTFSRGAHSGQTPPPVGKRTLQGLLPPARLLHPGGSSSLAADTNEPIHGRTSLIAVLSSKARYIQGIPLAFTRPSTALSTKGRIRCSLYGCGAEYSVRPPRPSCMNPGTALVHQSCPSCARHRRLPPADL